MKRNKGTLKTYTCLLVTCIFLMSLCIPEKAVPKKYTVEIIQMQFRPALLQVNKGDTIVFINKDLVDHDVTEVNKTWHSPPLSMGDSWKWVATKSADYYCSIHLVMKGQIVAD